MPHHATLLLHYPDALADALHGALAPEAERGDVPKTASRVARDGGAVRIDIDADDLGALRAALNSYLRWADAAERAAGLASRRA